MPSDIGCIYGTYKNNLEDVLTAVCYRFWLWNTWHEGLATPQKPTGKPDGFVLTGALRTMGYFLQFPTSFQVHPVWGHGTDKESCCCKYWQLNRNGWRNGLSLFWCLISTQMMCAWIIVSIDVLVKHCSFCNICNLWLMLMENGPEITCLTVQLLLFQHHWGPWCSVKESNVFSAFWLLCNCFFSLYPLYIFLLYCQFITRQLIFYIWHAMLCSIMHNTVGLPWLWNSSSRPLVDCLVVLTCTAWGSILLDH